MKHPIHFIFATLLVSTIAVYAQFEGLTYTMAESAAARLDLRDGFGGRVVQGVVVLSTAEGTVKCDGKAVGTSWDTTKLADGWNTLSCNGRTERICVRNDASIRLEEGRIVDRVTWDNDVIHVVRNNVYVPNGVTLSISEGAIVKFAEDSRIIVEHGGKIAVNGGENLPIEFAQVADDSIGGDTDLQNVDMEDETVSRIDCYGNEAWTDNSWFAVNHVVIGVLPYLSVQPVRAMRQGGFVRIPVTVSGTRNTSFAVDWQTADGTAKYGVDFTENSGRVSWTSTSAGARYIEIPLVTETQADEDVMFTVRLTKSYGANIQTAEAVVTIFNSADSAFENLTVATATSQPVRLDLRDDFGGRIAQGVMAMSNTDGDVMLNGKVIGKSWDTTKLKDGWVELSQGGETRDVAILNTEAVHCEEGRLTENTTWDNSAVRLIRNDVYIPSGVTLTITEGTIVKFTEDTRIIIENGGKLQMNGTEDAFVQFAMATDDGYAGDTDMREAEVVFPANALIYNYSNGTVADNGYVASRGLVISGTYPYLTAHGAAVYEDCGMVYLPLTLSGSRNSSFYAEWVATDGTATFGEDYGLASSKLTWNSTNDGTKYIAIPIIKGNLAAEEETFTVRLVASGGANIQTTAVTVTIRKMADAGLDGLVHATVVSDAARLDLRDGFGGRIVRGTIDLSTTEGKVSLNGKELSSPWKSTTSKDGWYELAQNGQTAEICVLNDNGVALEEGRLIENTTWDDTAVHLIRNDIYVPNGVTLTLTDGAVVKFTEDTRIIVEHGGKISVQGAEGSPVKFALATDDTYGGDTDLRDGEMDVPSYSLISCYNTSNGWTDNGNLVSHQVAFNTLPTVSIHNSRVMEHEGVVMIPVTVSGTRKASFAVDWKATDGTAKLNNDYTLSSGRVSWTSTDNGTRYIEIPVVKDNVAEELEEFTVMLTASSGTNIATAESTVSIVESAYGISADAVYKTNMFTTEEPVEVDERTDTFSRLARDVETLRYSTEWTKSSESKSVRLTVLLDAEDEKPLILFESEIGVADGTVVWETKSLETGRYILAHETLDDRGRLQERLETIFFINREVIVHEGILSNDETWDDSAIHVVSHDVFVPAGVQLDITAGAVVKFLEGRSIIARLGGVVNASGATFTHISDDSIAGDTNLDGTATQPRFDSYSITGDGATHIDSSCRFLFRSIMLPSGTLSSNITLSGSLGYKATGSLTIARGYTLTIEPGAVLKFDSGQGITVSSGATLNALGTRAQPIVFTSIKDDAHGGDTNIDGNKSEPQPGDWGQIYVSGGTVNLSYSQIYYCGSANSMNDAIYMGSGSCTLNNCIVAHVLQYVAGLDGGTWTMRNSVFYDFDTAFRHFGSNSNINCVFFDFGNLTNNGSMNFTNCIIANYSNALLWTNWGSESSDSSIYQNCVIWNPVGLGPQSSVKVHSNGNIWANPLFNDPDNGDFTLMAGSPCIDAGDGTVAPELDYFGQPRQDIHEVEDTGTVTENGAVPDIGIHEVLPRNAAADVDFVAVSINGSSSARVGERIMAEWTIRNDGGEAIVGSWRDYVYLVAEDGKETLLGSLVTTKSIAPNGLLVLKLDFLVPDVDAGEYRLKLKCNMNRDIFEGTLTANNVVVSEGTVMISYPKAAVKDGISGSLSAGESIVKLMDVEEGYSLALIQAPKGTKVYYSLGSIPTAESHVSGVTCLDGTTMLSLPTGDIYLLVVAPDGEACDYRIDFTEDRLQISRLEPSTVMRDAVSHVLVHGSMFSSKAVVHLLRNGKDIELPGKVLDDDDILVTIEASKLDAGDYDVKVVDYDGDTTLKNALHVTNGASVMNVRYALNMPDAVRTGRWFTVTLEYENTGNVEMPAPIFHLKSNGRNFDVDGTVHENEVWLYGIGTEYPYAWLRPGHVCKATFKMQLMANAEASVSISCASMASDDVGETLDLRGFFEEEWLLNKDAADAEMLARLRTAVGTTKGDYRRNLADFYDAAGYGSDAAVSFSSVQKEFFYQAVQGAYEDSNATSMEQTRSGSSFGDCPSDSCALAGRLLVYDSSLHNKGHRNADASSEESNEYDFAGKKWKDKYNDGSHAGDIWWFHKECNWWHRATLEEVKKKFVSNTDVYVICHGNACSLQEELNDWWVSPMAQRIMAKKSKATVLAVDWGDIAQEKEMVGKGMIFWSNEINPEYAAPYIPAVAYEMCLQLDDIFGLHFGGKQFTLIGHSHGGHLAGHVAKHLEVNGCKAKRLVGMDTSPMNTHEEVAASLKFPNAWDGTVADSVEFYKTSFGFSMGTSNDNEVYGCPSFFVLGADDDFKRDLYEKGGQRPSKKSDALRRSLRRHGFSHDWFSNSIADLGTKFGWNWKPDYWKDQPITQSEPLKPTFCGVLSEKVGWTSLELGTDCVVALNRQIATEPNGVLYRGKVDGTNWRFYSRIVGKAADAGLGLTGYSALERLWNLDSLLVEYYAKSLDIENPNEIHADGGLNVSFTVGNYADNLTMNTPRILPHWLNPIDDSRDRSPDQLPWEYQVNGERRSICNAIHAYDLSQLSETERNQLINESENRSISASALIEKLRSNERISGFELHVWTGENAYIPAGDYGEQLKTKDSRFIVPDEIMAKRDSLPVGFYRDSRSGEAMEYPDGEPFLLVGRVAQVYMNGGYEDYPGDLYLGDNYVAKIVFVKKSNGKATAICREMIASSDTRGGDLRGEEGETQDDYGWEFRTVTDANGNWSIRLSGDRSWTTNKGGLQFYYFTVPEEVGMYQKMIREPDVTLSGTLPEGCEARRYSVKLKVLDFIEVFGEVTVDVVVSRPQQCMCMDGGLCICKVCKCGERGATGPNSPQSCDPNEISGMVGVGDSGTQRFVKRGEELTYTIYFENKADAEAAAQEVRVTSELSKWLDWSTFQIVEVGFNNQIDTGLAGKSDGMSEISLDGTSWKVRSEMELNQKKGLLNCYLRIVDETTEDGWPEDPYAGFLPPNDSTHRGEGYVRYKVKVRDDAPDGAFVNAEATIVFDYNEPITTSPAWFNWVTTEENPVADNSTLRWDTSGDPEGTTYVVNYWSGDPDPTAPGTTITFNSETLATGSWKLPNLYPDTYYWNVTKTHDGEPSQTSTWSFDILAYHSLTVHGGIGSGTYRTSTLVTVEANTMEGRPFIGWTATGIDLSHAALSSHRLEFYMPDNDVTLTANYEELFTVTIRNGSADKATASAGETVAITANKAAEGMAFDKWTSDDVVFADASSIRTSFTMPAKNVIIKATYREQDGIILLPGWNLIAVPGDLPQAGNEALFAELNPFRLDRETKSYVHASLPLAAGTPLWIYGDSRRNVQFDYEDAGSVIGGVTTEAGWHLVGVGGEEDVMIGNVLSVWQWGHGRWSPVEIQEGMATLSAGRGYFIYKEEGDVAVMSLGWIRRYFDGEEFDWSDDADGDGLANWEEYKHGTDPVKMDTDGDSMSDGWEIRNNKNPLDPNDIDPEMRTSRYLVVDLSGGPDAESYPVRYTSTEPNLNDDTCRTTELWLRRIPKGTFTMGSPDGEVGGYPEYEPQHDVTLTQDYYIGVFECTQRQWELVMGDRPSWFDNDDYYAVRPVECVTYEDVRGTSATGGGGWPEYGHRVDEASFFGKLQAKTGLTFDLPMEAQWEYACRAGTTTALNSGKNLTAEDQDEVLDEVCRYYFNGGGDFSQETAPDNGTAVVGSYKPNGWGLYDMHGNVWEWCLDWAEDYSGDAEVDPKGSKTGEYRIVRGGGWNWYACVCRSAARDGFLTEESLIGLGFRVACHISQHMYTISVDDGTASLDKAFEGETVTITANEPEEGMVFDKWVSDDIEIVDITETTTTFVMPAKAVTVTALYIPKQHNELYVVVDLSGGPDATKYPVHYTDMPPNLDNDICRTTELWLRKIPAGTFIMGSSEDEVGHYSDETQHEVTLTQDYYIGVFECTQKQWELVMGTKPSYFNNATYYATRPVEQVSYDDIRGTNWPSSGHTVDASSFMGRLKKKTVLTFDLPTEAQWEYACRAGTTTALNSGKNLTSTYSNTAMNKVGRYWYNGGSDYSQLCTTDNGTAKVGSYQPNAWGLYDMHGNVREWCLDWYDFSYGTAAVSDPVGRPTTGPNRVRRGGSWNYHAQDCRSAYRGNYNPFDNYKCNGFRITLLP